MSKNVRNIMQQKFQKKQQKKRMDFEREAEVSADVLRAVAMANEIFGLNDFFRKN